MFTVDRAKTYSIAWFTFFIAFLFSSNAGGEEGKGQIVASYTTSVAHQENAVKQNIALAAKSLNGITISPGQTFSFNKIVGSGSAERGYLSGRVLYVDKIAYEAGGGICQVSSTLYNALLRAGFIIKERHRHYQPVSYVPLGLDATIKYGKKDLRMKNPHNFSFQIFTELSEETLVIIIRARNGLPLRYEITTDEEEINLPIKREGEMVRPGFSILVYRHKYRGKKLLGTYLLYKDFYPPAIVER